MKKKGFTLIELIVVIAIIAILSAVVLISYAGAQKRSHDATRKSDLNAIATAVMSYYSSHKRMLDYGGALDSSNVDYGALEDKLKGEGFLTSIPVDPLESNLSYYLYLSLADKAGAVYAKMETNDRAGNQCAVDTNCLGAPPAGYNYGIMIKP